MPASEDTYFEQKYGTPPAPAVPPPVPPKPKPKTVGDRVGTFFKGALGQSNRLLELIELAGSTAPILADKIHSIASGHQTTEAQDWWFKNTVDRAVANQQMFDLPEGADFGDKALHGVGSTLMMIDQAIASGGEAGPASTILGRAAIGGARMTAPAAANAVDVGRQVMQATGDKKAAAVAGTTSYIVNLASGAVPMGVGGTVLKRVGSAALTGPVLGEAQRRVQNAAMPESMQAPFDPVQSLVESVTSAPFGLLPHAAVEQHHTIMDHAQEVAANEVAAQGGDSLDQTVAATHVNAVLGAHHDAAEYEGNMEVKHQQAAQDLAEVQSTQEQFDREAALNQAEKLNTPAATPEAGFESLEARRTANEADVARTKEADYGKALNQRGDQQISAADDLNRAFEVGGGEEAKPTIADTLSPEQRTALNSLKERRRIAQDLPAEKAAEPESDQDFTPLPPQKNAGSSAGKAAQAIAAMRPKPVEPVQEAPVSTERVQAPEVDETELESKAVDRARIQDQFRRETEFEKNSNYQRLMQAKPGEHAGLVEDMPIKEAQEHLDRLTSAPGINKPAQEALEAHINGTVDAAAHEAAPSPQNDLEPPTEAEHKAGNFQMGHTEVAGMPVTVEYPAGSDRPAPEGPRTMAAHYGYFKGTMGADGMHVDTLVGKEPAQAKTAFIVDHLDPSGEWQQHKVLLGFPNRIQAMRAYRAAYPDNPLGPVSQVKVGELRSWLKEGDTTKPYDQRAVNRLGDTRARFSTNESKPTDPEAVEHTASAPRGDGGIDHTYTMHGGGELRAREYPERGATHVLSADVRNPGMRGRGIGTSLLERAVQDAHERGQVLHSDTRVSRMQQGTYASLKDRGYDVRENPNEEGGSGEKVSASELKGAYTVHPKADAARTSTAPKGWDRVNEGTDQGPKQRLAEAYRAVKPITDKLGGEGVTVHSNDRSPSIPQHLADQIKQRGYAPGQVKGMYDPTTDQVHIFADSHRSADDVGRTAIHEIAAHKGLRNLLGEDYTRTMHDVYSDATAPAKTWMRDYADRHSVDLRTVNGRALAADEYAAHLAETPQEAPGVLGKIRDGIRSGLRKLGLVREWTDDDIHSLLKRAATNLSSEAARSGARAKGPGLRLSTVDDEAAEQWPADHPLAVEAKFGRTMEEQANYNPGYIRRINDWSKDAWGKTLDTRLGAIQLRNLPDFLNERTRPLMPSMKKFINTHDAMDGRRGQLMEPDYHLATKWAKWDRKNPAMGHTLSELMNASTLAGVDPSKPHEARYTDEQKAKDPTMQAHDDARAGLHRRLQKMYNEQLDDTGRKLYNDVRDTYQDKRATVLAGLEARINESSADGKSKQKLLTELRTKFEAGRVQGPYFPLSRFGDHWASAKDSEGNTISFTRFDSRSQQKAWVEEAKAKGYAVDAGKRMDERSLMERIDPDFVKKVMEITSGDKPMQDEIWQAYLKAMPEMSMRKNFIHRIGRLGFSGNTLRAFAYNAFHSAHQIARLEYGNRLDTIANDIKTEGRNVEAASVAGGESAPTSADADYASGLAREMARRLDWIKNPRSGNLASQLTKFGFGWYLGFAPATAFRIFSQNPMIAQPILAAKHGQLGATKELSRASAQWAMSKGNLGDTLRGDERTAFDEASDRGIFSNTYAQTLASGGNDRPIGVGHIDAFNKAAAYLFNGMEHHNRMSTFLASYRLGRTSGMDHEAAMDHAVELTQLSHFDYTNANRPRWLQNDFAKVAMLFRQYAWGVTYALGRNFRNATRMDAGVTPEARVEATKAFTGLLARGMMFSGVTGLPMYWVAEHIMNMLNGDEDRPYDSTAALKSQLVQHVGQTAADAITTGPLGALTGAALSHGASYNDLWYKSPSSDLSTKEYVTDAMGQFMGAVPAVATNAAQGADMIAHGNVERGMEHFLPPAFAAMAKAARYSREGVTNTQGEPVVDRNQLDNRDLFLQAIGFTPQKVADAYAQNSAIKNIDKALKDRREYLINRLVLASSMNDTDEIDQALTDIGRFNEKNADLPGVQIKAHGLISSARNHFKQQAEAINGVRLPPGMYGLQQQYGAQPQEQEPQE